MPLNSFFPTRKRILNFTFLLTLCALTAYFIPSRYQLANLAKPAVLPTVIDNAPTKDKDQPTPTLSAVLGEQNSNQNQSQTDLTDKFIEIKGNLGTLGQLIQKNGKFYLAKNIITNENIQWHTVRDNDLANNSVTSRIIKDHTIQSDDLASNLTMRDLTVNGKLATDKIDLGRNTITDGNLRGNWNLNGGNLTTTGTITAHDLNISGATNFTGKATFDGTVTLGGLMPQTSATFTPGMVKTDIVTATDPGQWGLYNDSQKFIAMGPDGFPRIVYFDNAYTDLKFVQCLDENCATSHIETIAHADNGVDEPVIKMGSDGLARVAYINWNDPNEIHYLQCNNDSCSDHSDELIGTGSLYEISLALDDQNKASITYNDSDDNEIRFINCQDTTCTTKTTTDLTAFNYGSDIASAIAPDGFARIVHWDRPNRLYFIKCNNVDCSDNTSTSTENTAIGDVYYLDMALGTDGLGRIAYGESGNELKFVRCTNETCSTKESSSPALGSNSDQISLEMAPDSYARISYDSGNGEVYVQCTNADCSNKIATAIGVAGGYPNSMVIGADGYPRIVYTGSDGKTLKLFKFNSEDGRAINLVGASIGSATSPFGSIFGNVLNSKELNIQGNSSMPFSVKDSLGNSLFSVDGWGNTNMSNASITNAIITGTEKIGSYAYNKSFQIVVPDNGTDSYIPVIFYVNGAKPTDTITGDIRGRLRVGNIHSQVQFPGGYGPYYGSAFEVSVDLQHSNAKPNLATYSYYGLSNRGLGKDYFPTSNGIFILWMYPGVYHADWSGQYDLAYATGTDGVSYLDNGAIQVANVVPYANRNTLFDSPFSYYSIGNNNFYVNGRVGIGTTNPTGFFQVGSGATPALMATSPFGNIGIGTTNPGAKLEINSGSAGVTGMKLTQVTSGSSAGAGNGKVLGLDANGNIILVTDQVGSGTSLPTGTLAGQTLYYNGSNWVTNVNLFNNAGNIGIGTTNPLAKLEVAGSGAFALGTALLPSHTFNGDLNTGMWSSGADTINFSTNGSERLRINSSGYVGIGTMNPKSALDTGGDITLRDGNNSVYWNAYYSDQNRYVNNGYAGSITFDTNGDFFFNIAPNNIAGTDSPANFNDSFLAINHTGNVGIGVEDPYFKLAVSGTIFSKVIGGNSFVLNTFDEGFGTISSPADGIWSLGYSSDGEALGSNTLSWTRSGNVGIGTTDPGQRFSIAETFTGAGVLDSNNPNAAMASIIRNVKPASDELRANGYFTRHALTVATNIPADSTKQQVYANGIDARTKNFGTGFIYDLESLNGNTYNAQGNVNWMAGVYGSSQSDGGNINDMVGVEGEIYAYGGSVSNLYGFYAYTEISGATVANQYGVYIESDGLATDNYGLYQENATSKNYFAGNVGIGTTNPQTLLQVNGDYQFPYGQLYVAGSVGNDTFISVNTKTGTVAGLDLQYNGTSKWSMSLMNGNDLAFWDDNAERLTMKNGGNIGIGTTNPTQKLTVAGNINVVGGSFIDDGTTLTVPDYVFEPNYNLKSIPDLETYINQNLHLPNVPSQDQIKKTGMNYGSMLMSLLEKTEENTLYTIDNYHQITQLDSRLNSNNLSTDDKMNIISQNLTDLNLKNQELADLQKQAAAQTKDLASLQKQMDELQAQTKPIIDFYLALDLKNMLMKDNLGNVTLLDGKITAKDIEALNTFKAKDIEAQTLKLDDAGIAGQGTIKSGETDITINSPYASETAKISLTPKGSTSGKNIYVDDIIEGVSFKVKIDDPAITKNITFYWFIIK